jgi:hypothetical protein
LKHREKRGNKKKVVNNQNQNLTSCVILIVVFIGLLSLGYSRGQALIAGVIFLGVFPYKKAPFCLQQVFF